MTVNLSVVNRKHNLGDRILRICGRERLPVMPGIEIGKLYEELGFTAHISADCEWEGFWHCLFRKRHKKRYTL